jgi:HK97 family phage portal protein
MFNWKRQNQSKNHMPVAVHGALRAQWTPRQYMPLVKEGYEKNVIVYRCVSLIAKGVSSIPWVLYDGGHEVLDHPLYQLLKNPGAGESWSSLMESIVTSFLCSGNAYIMYCGDTQQLSALRPDRVRIVTKRGGGVLFYDYTEDGETKRYDARGEKTKIIHLKSVHPLNDWYGLSPIEVAAMAIDQHNAVSAHNLALLQNGGRPSGVFIWRGENGYGLTQDQRESFRESVTSLYAGSGNAGRIAVVEGDVEWKEMGLSPKDMDFVEGKHVAAREIAQVFGVPTMLIGVPGDSTYANYKEARYHLWEDTILPLLERIQMAFTRHIAVLFGADLKFSYDVDAIPALAPRREATWNRITNAGFLTDEEKRLALGYTPTL